MVFSNIRSKYVPVLLDTKLRLRDIITCLEDTEQHLKGVITYSIGLRLKYEIVCLGETVIAI